MEKIFVKKFLIKNVKVNYFSGNNLLIIEFKRVVKNKYDIKSLLIFNYLDENKNNKNALFISFKVEEKNKLEIYKELLDQNTYLNLKKIQINSNNNIINFDVLLNIDNLDLLYKKLMNISEQNIKKEILKILFYIYYFEKNLKTDLNLLNKNENYCLINSKWIQKSKEYIDYKKIFDYLINYNNKNINYNNLDEDINSILDSYLDKNSNTKNSNSLKELENSEIIKPSFAKIDIFFIDIESYIIPEKIIEMIKKNVFKNIPLAIKTKKIFVQNNRIFL